MATAEQRFDADKQYAYRALQDARLYVTDFDASGRKAAVLYERLARASRMMRPWSTDGTPAQAKKAIEYLNEITSILSEKIGPASRREFSEQHPETPAPSPSPARVKRDVDALLGSGASTNIARFADSAALRLDRGESVTLPYAPTHGAVVELVRRGYRVMRAGLQGSPGLPFTTLKR